MSQVYRPKAPADDFGNIPATYDLRDPALLAQEAHRAAEEFKAADGACDHRIRGASTPNGPASCTWFSE
jgi:hypothetical protein